MRATTRRPSGAETVAKKLYYKIGEACKILEIQPYVLRYWETEFPFLKPNKSKSGQRVYSDREIDIIRRIKELLYEEGYTIAGAKKKLESELETASGPEAAKAEVSLKKKTARPEGGRSRKAADPDPGGGRQSVEAEAQLKRYRRGVEAALRQTREILEALQP